MTKPAAPSQRLTRLIERLRTRRGRPKEGMVLVEGIRAVDTALGAGPRVRFAVVSPRLQRLDGGVDLAGRLEALGADVRHASDEELARLSDTETPQGVLVLCEEPSTSLQDLEVGRYLVLDGVQDPGNAGTLVRAATAFGLDGVVALDGTVDLWGPKAVRASAGLAFTLPVVRCEATEAVAHFRRTGAPLLAADATGEDVGNGPAPARFALVVGNEGAGVRAEIAAGADRHVAVPMRGPAESLNVGIAGSILLYALTREERGG